MQITRNNYMKLSKELRELSVEIEECLQEVRDAAALGDLRENEEYATAKSNSERLLYRKAEIESILSEAEIISEDKGNIICIGCKVAIKRVDRDEPERIFVLETSGSTVLDGVLGVESPLGKEILNGTDGVYTVHNNGGIQYAVRKVME